MPLGQTFFEPTVLANVSSDAKVAQEETFGPWLLSFALKQMRRHYA